MGENFVPSLDDVNTKKKSKIEAKGDSNKSFPDNSNFGVDEGDQEIRAMEEDYPFLKGDQEVKESTLDKLNNFFIQTGLDKERLNDKEGNMTNNKEKLLNARFNFVQYLHYLGFKLFVTSEYTKQGQSEKAGKETYKYALAKGDKMAPMYMKGFTAYIGTVDQNEILRNFIEENKDKNVINGIKLPGGKKLSELKVPKERKN